ncbi:MAG: SPOR domain-containing protein [Desulfovibrio sp.]|nr:SPOR domain-containing protein [Desulfovibrio sp.]
MSHNSNTKAAPGYALRISGMAVGILLAVLAAVVGWAFFMGFMVGSGQSPAQRMEAMTGMLQQESPVPDAERKSPDIQPSSNGPAEKEMDGPAREEAKDFPFARPSGEGLAAWGISVETSAAAPETEAPGAEPPAVAPAAAPPASQEEALYDFVFQTAAFRSRADADALRDRLEDRGMRSRVQQSGKVYLVTVLLRGSQREADNLAEELQRMKLGKPIQLSRKAASAPRGRRIR